MSRESGNEVFGKYFNDMVKESLIQMFVIDEMADQHARGAHWDPTVETVAYRHELSDASRPTPTETDYVAATGSLLAAIAANQTTSDNIRFAMGQGW